MPGTANPLCAGSNPALASMFRVHKLDTLLIIIIFIMQYIDQFLEMNLAEKEYLKKFLDQLQAGYNRFL